MVEAEGLPPKSGSKSKPRRSTGKDESHAGTSVSMSTKDAMDPGDDPAAAAAAGATSHAASANLFARSVAMMTMAHIARGVGYDAVQRSAADVLVDIVEKYVQQIGVAAKDVAELAGRTQPCATDVIQALRDLETAPVELNDLIKAMESAKRPFPRDVPSFPVRKRDATGNAIEQNKIGHRNALPPHVPSFLPSLPNRHTYSADSHVVVEREQDTKRTRLDLLGQKSEVQKSLHGLQTTLTRKVIPMVHQPSWNAFQGVTGENASANPFVQPPSVSPGSGDSSSSKSIFEAPEREFVPSQLHSKSTKKDGLHTGPSALTKPSSHELGKEEKILTGTFHDGDSE